MASRKVLKKNVNYIAGELFAECLMNSLYVPGTDKKKADELMAEILKMQDEFISRISHTEPGNVKGYYKKFRSDFNAKVDSIIEAIQHEIFANWRSLPSTFGNFISTYMDRF